MSFFVLLKLFLVFLILVEFADEGSSVIIISNINMIYFFFLLESVGLIQLIIKILPSKILTRTAVVAVIMVAACPGRFFDGS
jgi:hypothetical protein